MRAIVCMPEMEPLDILPCIITVHIPTFDIWTPSKEEVLFVNFSFMCLILTGFPPERNGGCAVQLPVPLQHTKKIMFSKTTNETAANAFFFCQDQQHEKFYLFPPGLWSSVPAIAFLNNHHPFYLFHVAYTLQCMNSNFILWIFLTALFTHTRCAFMYFFLNNLMKNSVYLRGFCHPQFLDQRSVSTAH